jgi:hypothetical protein
MSADILGVHGVGCWSRAAPADAARDLAATWRTALGLESVAAAYYAHHLRTYHQGPPDDLEELHAELDGQASALLTALMAAHGWRDDPAQGRTLAPIRQLASWFVLRYNIPDALAERFLVTFLSEVGRYFDPRQPTGRLAACTEVATAISAHRPRIVIAHSLGSVITYETLWAYPTVGVELLITIGSPLALPNGIHPRLRPAPINGQGHRPQSVARWINIADPADLVAIPRHLSHYFHGIDIDIETPAGPGFTHAATAYLQTPQLRTFIAQHLAGPRTLHPPVHRSGSWSRARR